MVALNCSMISQTRSEICLPKKMFKMPSGGQTALNVFEQNLPMRDAKQMRVPEVSEDEAELDEVPEEYGDEELNDLFPYCIVKLDQGMSESSESTHDVSTKLIIGIYDDGMDAAGYKDILNIIEDIRCRFRRNPILKRQIYGKRQDGMGAAG